MLKGYSLPRTPKGISSLVTTPPWHYVGNCLAVEYEADADAVAAFLPPGLEYHSASVRRISPTGSMPARRAKSIWTRSAANTARRSS